MSPGLLVTLLALGTWRLTRLVTADDFPPVQATRDWVLARAARGRDGRLRWYGELISCSWCVSVWLAAGVTGLAVFLLPRGLPAPLAVWGALAAVAALLEHGQRWLFSPGDDQPATPLIDAVETALADADWRLYLASKLVSDHGYEVYTPTVQPDGGFSPRGVVPHLYKKADG